MPSFIEIGPQVPEKILKVFYHTWAWPPSWSCDLDYLYTHWFQRPIDLAFVGQAVSGKKGRPRSRDDLDLN